MSTRRTAALAGVRYVALDIVGGAMTEATSPLSTLAAVLLSTAGFGLAAT